MSSRKRVQGYQETLAFSKCKRIIRPLLSKIHGLHDLNCKYPNLIEFNFPIDEIRTRCKNSGVSNNTYSSRKSTNRNDPLRFKRLKLLKSNDKYDDSESDSNHELTFILPSSSPLPQKTYEKTYLNKIDDFVYCSSSLERMKALKPFISKDLYQSYEEIFQVFKNIITNVVIERHNLNSISNVLKLSSICSYKIGKSIALSTKTTYHKLSHSLLFDSNSIPPNLQRFNQNLNDDVDCWFEMEPEVFSRTYRDDFLIGYVIHLLIFNLSLVLYNLIPILIHWLMEELSVSGITKLAEIGRNMFSEYWHFSETYFEGIDSELFTTQNHYFNTTQNFRAFWLLYEVGYWENFISQLKVFTEESLITYHTLLLDTLPLNNKLDLEKLFQLDLELQNHDFLKNNVYCLIKQYPQHPQVNNILITIITNTIWRIRSDYKLVQRTNEMQDYLKTSYDRLFNFISLWLSFAHENNVVFNSLYPGNNIMFQAILKILKKLEGKCTIMIKKVGFYLDELDSQYSDDYNFYRNIKEIFLEYREEFNVMGQAILVLKSYYLDKLDVSISDIRINSVSKLIIELQTHVSQRGKYNLPEFNNFITWLYEKNHEHLLKLAQYCFQAFYGTPRYYKHEEIEYIYQLLFHS